MYSALRSWFIPRPPTAVDTTYIALVAAARNPFFYTELEVPDSIDGRFEMIVLHLFLLQHRLMRETGEDAKQFSQFLSESFVADLDANLREMGVADTGVSHRMKKMGKAYHGRLQVYAAALGDDRALRAALARNVYGTVREGDVTVLAKLGQFVQAMTRVLGTCETDMILAGRFTWPDPATRSAS